MNEGNVSEWRRTGRQRSGGGYEGRQGLITRAARTCFERRGVGKTSIADITREVNITRELFYYYYKRKDAVIDAVMDTFVDDARALLDATAKLARTTTGMIDAVPSLEDVINVLREWLKTDEDAPLPMTELLRETGLWPQIAFRVATEACAVLRGKNSGEDADYGLCAALIGAMTLIQCDDDISSEVLASSIAPLLG